MNARAPAPAGPTNPFPGLRPFREDEEGLFFGRETQVDAMVDTLRATHFLVVVGTSGSGKSSLVNCGLIPALHRGLMEGAGSGWRVATLRPGNRPMRALAAALARVVAQPATSDSGFSAAEILAATLAMSKLGLVDAYRQAPVDATRPNLLVVVDQFEELFRYRALAASSGGDAGTAAGEQAIAFVNLLLEVTAHAPLPLHVVLTMRSDFLGDCSQFNGLPEAINRGQYLVPRMTREQRRAAIAGPLAVRDIAIDPVLLTRLVNDVGDNPDQLSILQHALNRTWARWQSDGGQGPLAPTHYDAVGTMTHALNQHAEEAYAELAEGAPRALCERIFRAITDKITDVRGTRSPRRVDTLVSITGATLEEIQGALAPFRDPSRAFVMPPHDASLQGDTPIDISHESLMRVWQRLDAWGDDEARSAQMYRRLAETAALHAAGETDWLDQPELQVALDWRARERPNAAWAERYRPGFDGAMSFLDASAGEFERKCRTLEEDAKARRHEVARADEMERKAQDEATRREATKFWRNVVVAVSLTALAFLGVAFAQVMRAQLASEVELEAAKRALGEAAVARQRAEEASKEAADASAAVARTVDSYAMTQKAILSAASPELQRQIERLQLDAERAIDAKPLVYVQYASDRQAELAMKLRTELNAADYSAPGIEKVAAAPARNELRYFRAQDEAAARELAGRLPAWGVADVNVKLVKGYDAPQVRQFEVWLAASDDDEIQRLFRGLTSASQADRQAAGQTLQKKYAASSDAIAAALKVLSPESVLKLSVDARINILYFLTRTSPDAWTAALVQQADDGLRWLDGQQKAGVTIGSQTRAEITRLNDLLDRVRSNGQAAKPAS